jgi:hypothetical protein
MCSANECSYWLRRTAVTFGTMVLSGASGVPGAETLAAAAGAAGCPWFLPLSGGGAYATISSRGSESDGS